MKLLLLLTALLPLVSSEECSLKDSNHYLAAVVEYSPQTDSVSGLPLVLANVRYYENLIATASSLGADIIVFPEAGLTGFGEPANKHFFSEVPHPHDFVSPCAQPSRWGEPLRRLSCAARANRIYVAVNLNEQSGSKRHNTNLVFNRDGVVISRYRKLHLFHEPLFEVPEEIDNSIFHTDFGVTFGVAICFDLLFREPSELSHRVSHFVYSTAWFSEVPFLAAVQTQAAWSWSHNSVLLASGINVPGYGSTGSGIFAGRMGPIKSLFTGEKTTQLLIGRVPKDLSMKDDSYESCSDQETPDKKHFESISSGKLRLLKDWMQAFATQLLPQEVDEKDNMELCHEKFCCSFNMRKEITSSQGGRALSETDLRPYRLFAWNGVRDFSGAATGGVQLCGVVACLDATDVMTCGMPNPNDQSPMKVKFSKLQIHGTFEANDTMLLANTADRQMLPLPANSYNLIETEGCNETENVKCMTMTLLREQDELGTFAIYNRVFGRDNSKYTHKKP